VLTVPGYVARNLLRQKLRTVLAAFGVTLGVWLVVLFQSIAGGALRTAESMLTQFGEDFHCYKSDVADQFLSTLPESRWRTDLRAFPGVRETASVLAWLGRTKRTPFLYILGLRPEEFAFRRLAGPDPVDLSERDGLEGVLLGHSLMEREKVKAGGVIEVGDQKFRVAGAFRTGQPLFENALVMPLSRVQARFLGGADIANFIAVKVSAGADRSEVSAGIEKRFPGISVVSTLDELSKVDQGLERMRTWSLVITFVATGIGWLFVLLAMVMSVYERTREIGILRAVGWTQGRIVSVVFVEALLLSAVGVVFAIPTGFLAVEAIAFFTDLGNWVRPEYGAPLYLKSLLVGVLAAGIGAIYPAWRAARLRPVEAIRHE
jgi:putative ABC transport system permease protein